VPLKWAKYIFQWDSRGRRAAEYVYEHDLRPELVEANWELLDIEDAVAVLRALQDGGWQRGKFPKIVVMAMYALRDRGLSARAIAEYMGVTLNQVEYQFRTKGGGKANAASRAAVRMSIG
jgi:hypothetical protein